MKNSAGFTVPTRDFPTQPIWQTVLLSQATQMFAFVIATPVITIYFRFDYHELRTPFYDTSASCLASQSYFSLCDVFLREIKPILETGPQCI